MNTSNLRKHLTEQMTALKDGCIDNKEANAQAKLAHEVIKSLNSDLADKRMEIKLGRTIPKKLKSLEVHSGC